MLFRKSKVIKSNKINKDTAFDVLLSELSAGEYASDKISLCTFDLNDVKLAQLIAAIKSNPKTNAQILEIDLTSNKFRIINIDGLLGLKRLILDRCSAEYLTLNNLQQLRHVSAAVNVLKSAQFNYVPNLLSLDLHINKIEQINLDGQTSLEELNLAFNSFKELDFSVLRYLRKLNISGNRVVQVNLGNSSLSEDFTYSSLNMNDCSKLQVISRCVADRSNKYDLHPDTMEPDAEFLEFDSDKALTELKSVVTDIQILINRILKKYLCINQTKLNAWMWNAQQTYAYCMLNTKLDRAQIQDFVLKNFAATLKQYMYSNIQSSIDTELDVFKQYVKDIIDPMFASYISFARKNLTQNKAFNTALERFTRDNKRQQNINIPKIPPGFTTQLNNLVIESALQNNSTNTAAHLQQDNLNSTQENAPTGCLPGFKPLTWIATNCYPSSALQHITVISKKFKHS